MTDVSAGETGKHPIHQGVAAFNASEAAAADAENATLGADDPDPGPPRTFAQDLADLVARYEGHEDADLSEMISTLEEQARTLTEAHS